MSRLCLYYRTPPETDRWVPGDRWVRPLARRVIRGKPRPGGIDKVFHNLCLGLDRLGVEYSVNLPFKELKSDDRVGVLGRGRYSLQGYDRTNPIVAGIALMTHPSEWPTLCQDYPVKCYLQHSSWANDIYQRYFGDRCRIWPVGIDTDSWLPNVDNHKDIDLLVYDKVMWNREVTKQPLFAVIDEFASRRKLVVKSVVYGSYTEREYRSLLGRSRGMIFLCEHESQGLAYQECLSSGVPVLAWDQGRCLDPNRFAWGQPNISATSVPYFDGRCGERFEGLRDFDDKLSVFMGKLDASEYSPRDFVMENLTLRGCASRFLSFFE
jgi:glycosyltransferase involved in cell wall biosynthesis